ncbi:hypothetical protein BCY84_22581 [Trypanosoma cruzi cruzi]|nr:hypothetical protein BCY84_22606 [Trypanosoma cruzi cruzi]PBJ68029.1 hypothetical protein BCY84_22589 [Trypanosoma cruzi cruzi]PBJ68043.1 hypothetical protein BCY84_22581 [Trypanosoma cruzi cruzi]
MSAGIRRLLAPAVMMKMKMLRGGRFPVASYTTATPTCLQRKLTMSKRRLRPKPTPKPGPSIPICILLVLITLYMTYITRKSSNDDTVLR